MGSIIRNSGSMTMTKIHEYIDKKNQGGRGDC